MFDRILNKKMSIERPPFVCEHPGNQKLNSFNCGMFQAFPHDRDESNPVNHHRLYFVKDRYAKTDGLTMCEYSVVVSESKLGLFQYLLFDLKAPKQKEYDEINRIRTPKWNEVNEKAQAWDTSARNQ